MPAIADTENGGVGATPISLGFGDLHASPGDHIGHFYQTFAECKEILIPFLCEGLKAGDKCVYFLEPGSRLPDVRKELTAASVDVDGVMASGQLILDEHERSCCHAEHACRGPGRHLRDKRCHPSESVLRGSARLPGPPARPRVRGTARGW